MNLSAKTATFLLGVSQLIAQPSGFKLVQGEATPPHLENCAQVISSGNAIIEWDDFSVGEHERFEFRQGSVVDTILNRVTGSLRSNILGELHSNGKVILVNPQGVFIGPNGRIDAAGLIASSLDLPNEHFLSQNGLHFSGDSIGEIVNLGTIEAGGEVFLLGPNVRNDGTIRAAHAGLGVGRSILVRPEGAERILIQVPVEEGELSHSGFIEGLKVELRSGAFAKAIQCSGVIDANLFEERGGEIYLVADQGTCEVSGSLGARGGQIHVLGDTVHLLNGTEIDVSGVEGGGEVLIGGDYQGKNPNIKNAKYVWAGNETVVKADAIEKGNGGRVIFWADEAMSHFGKISIRGGEMGGDGGFAEVSGKSLDFRGLTDGGAPFGRVGTLLLDPTDITISTGADSGGSFSGCPSSYTPSGTPNTINTTTLQNLLNTPCSVTINTTSGSGGSGIITIANNITWSAATTLTLTPTVRVTMNSGTTISNTSASTGFNAVVISPPISTGVVDGSTLRAISTVGGNISITNTTTNRGITRLEGLLSTQDGAITVTSYAPSPFFGCCLTGIQWNTGGVTITGSGTLTMEGRGGTGGSVWMSGVSIASGIAISIMNGNCSITAFGGQGSNDQMDGLRIDGATITLNGTGSLTLTGTGGTAGSGTTAGPGILFSNTVLVQSIAGSTGSISMTGTGGTGTSSPNHGISFSSGTTVSLQGSGSLTLIGTPGGGGGAYGAFLNGNLTTSGGAITFGQTTPTTVPTTVFLNTGITIDSTNNGGTPAGGAITFNSSSTITGAQALTLKAGTSPITLGAAVGSITRLGAMTVTTTNNTADQGFRFNANLTVTSLDASGVTRTTVGANTLTVSSNNGTIEFGGIDSLSGNNYPLTLSAGSGKIWIHGAVGANQKLGTLTITSTNTTVGQGFGIGGVINLTNFSDLSLTNLTPNPITVLASLGTAGITTTNSAISFTQTIDAQTSGSGSFTLNAGTSTISLSGAIGGTTPLGAFTCTAGTSITLPTSTKTAGGAIALNGPVPMSAAVALDSTNGGLTATGANISITGAVTGAQALTLRAGSSGGITFGSAVGTSLTRVTTLTLTSGASLSLGGSLFLTNSVAIPMATTLTGNAEINTGP